MLHRLRDKSISNFLACALTDIMKHPLKANIVAQALLFSRKSIVAEAHAHVAYEEVGETFHGHRGGVDGEVVAPGVAPGLVGVEVVERCTQLVGPACERTRLFGVGCVVALDYASNAVAFGGMDEDVDGVCRMAQHIVGGAAHDYATFALGYAAYAVALGLVYAVGADAGGIGVPRHGVVAVGKGEHSRYEARHAFVVSLEILRCDARMAGGFEQKAFVVERYAETFGHEASEHASAAAE